MGCSESFACACNFAQSAPSVNFIFVNPVSETQHFANILFRSMDVDVRLTVGPPKLQSLGRESRACNQRLQRCYEYHVTTAVKSLIVLKYII